MDTKELLQAKRDMETKVADFINREIASFMEATGLNVSEVECQICGPFGSFQYISLTDMDSGTRYVETSPRQAVVSVKLGI